MSIGGTVSTYTILFPTREFIIFCSYRHWMISDRHFMALCLSFLIYQTENHAPHILCNSQHDSWKTLINISLYYCRYI